jgi:hypothetical protein
MLGMMPALVHSQSVRGETLSIREATGGLTESGGKSFVVMVTGPGSASPHLGSDTQNPSTTTGCGNLSDGKKPPGAASAG